MARLTREQSQALTREKLLQSACEVVARDGYDGASVERIAGEAGFSKGAFYSNFASKEDILLQLLESNAGQDVEELTVLLGKLDGADSIVGAVKLWSDDRSAEQRWGIIAIEFMRRARRDASLTDRHRNLFVDQWEGVGHLLVTKLFPGKTPTISALNLGGIVMELTYGGISGFLGVNTSGEMVALVLNALRAAPDAA